MRKTLATLLAVPILFFGVAFAADRSGSMDQPGIGNSDAGVESQQIKNDAYSTIDQVQETKEKGNESKAPEKSYTPVTDERVPSSSLIPDMFITP